MDETRNNDYFEFLKSITKGTDELIDLVTDSEEENVAHISPKNSNTTGKLENEINIKQKRKRRKKCGRKTIKSVTIDQPLYRDYFLSNKEFADSYIKLSISNYVEPVVNDLIPIPDKDEPILECQGVYRNLMSKENDFCDGIYTSFILKSKNYFNQINDEEITEINCKKSREEFEEYMKFVKNDYYELYDRFSLLQNNGEDRLTQKYIEFKVLMKKERLNIKVISQDELNYQIQRTIDNNSKMVFGNMRDISDDLCNAIRGDGVEEEKIHPKSCVYSIDSVIKYLKANKLDEYNEMYHKKLTVINIENIYIPPTFEYYRNYNSLRRNFEKQIIDNNISAINIESYKEINNQVKINDIEESLDEDDKVEYGKRKEIFNYSPISSDEEKEIDNNKVNMNEELEEEQIFSSDDDDDDDDDDEEEKQQQQQQHNKNENYFNNQNYHFTHDLNGMEVEYDNEDIEDKNSIVTKNRIDVIADVLYNEIKNTYIPYTYYNPISFELSIGDIYNQLINKKLKPYNQIYTHNRKIHFGISKQDYTLVEKSAIKSMNENIFCLKCGSYVSSGKELEHLNNDMIRNNCLNNIKYRNSNSNILDFERQIIHKNVMSVGGCLSKDNTIIDEVIKVDNLKNIDPICEICNKKFDQSWDSDIVDNVYTKMIIIEDERLVFYHSDCFEVMNVIKYKRKSIENSSNNNDDDLFSLFEDNGDNEGNYSEKKTRL